MPQQHLVGRARSVARIDLAPSHSRPAATRLVIATAGSIIGSLLADAILVTIGTSLFPSTKGFSHFRFSDYAVLTVIGVIAAGAGWGVVTRITSAPRWLFVRLAVLVTLALWLPDGWLLWKGEPPKAVAVLMVMHLAIALVTYNVLVHAAPIGRGDGAGPGEELHRVAAEPEPARQDSPQVPGPVTAEDAAGSAAEPAEAHLLWVVMASATAVEFLLGIAGLLVVPLGRPSGWIPSRGEPLYLAHAVLGAALAAGSLLLLRRAIHAGRLARIGAFSGAVGLLLGALGGVLAVYHGGRLAGMGLMLVGAMVAGFGYLIPVIS